MATEAAASSASPREDASHRINLSWLVRLRWGAIVGQLVTIAVVHNLMSIPLPLAPLLGLIGLEIITNVAAQVGLRSSRPVPPWALPITLAFDVIVLTGLLFFTGGPFNPFSFLCLVHIALAAVVLRSAWTWALVGLSLVCSGALFYGHVWLKLDYSDPAKHMQHMRWAGSDAQGSDHVLALNFVLIGRPGVGGATYNHYRANRAKLLTFLRHR
jgi:hypothetical protein